MFEAENAEIRILVDNYIDILLPEMEDPCISRWGLVDQFDNKRSPLRGEFGISFLVRAQRGDRPVSVLFDCGLTGDVLLHNAAVLSEPLEAIDHVFISHGHPDHYGGLEHLLRSVGRTVPVVSHADAFLPRYALMADGRAAPYYNRSFRRDAVESAGGSLVLTREPIELGWGICSTGEIPRETGFERPKPVDGPQSPGLYQVSPEGTYRQDLVMDEQALVIDVREAGLVVLTGCAHAGVINTLRRAQQLRPGRPIAAVLGGFHLGFPTTPDDSVDRTAAALKELDVRTVVPMHCSGHRAHAAFRSALPDRYVTPSVGTLLRFGR